MDPLWTAAEEYYAYCVASRNVKDPRGVPADMSIETYSGKLHDALEGIQRAQIALDGAGIDVDDAAVRREIQSALRCARRAADAAEKKASLALRAAPASIAGHLIFASVFRSKLCVASPSAMSASEAPAPGGSHEATPRTTLQLVANLFDAIVQRKGLSLISILPN